MLVIDLSHLVTNGMPVFPGTAPIVLKPVAGIDFEGINELLLQMTTHTGTHIDCPRHIINGGFDTTVSVGKFFGKGLLIDCLKEKGEISLRVFQAHEEEIRKVDFLLLYTGWDKNWDKPDYFGNFPVPAVDAADYLSGFELKGIGIDAPGFDPVNSTSLPVHNRLLSHGIILIENLTNLKSLPRNEFMFSCLPLKIENGDGCPVRAVGII